MKHICRTPPGAAHLAGRDCRRQRKNLHYWYRLMQKARLAAPITEAQIRPAQGFLRELDPDMSDLHNLQQRAITTCFSRKTACTGCTDLIVIRHGVHRFLCRMAAAPYPAYGFRTRHLQAG